MPRPQLRVIGVLLALVTVAARGASALSEEIAQGRTYFMRYCASCHGAEADGRGFVARALSYPPPDLRHLGEGNDTSLLADRLVEVIDGRKIVVAHGEREMPVWGERFDDIKAEGAAREKVVRERINAIVAYLLSIQVKALP